MTSLTTAIAAVLCAVALAGATVAPFIPATGGGLDAPAPVDEPKPASVVDHDSSVERPSSTVGQTDSLDDWNPVEGPIVVEGNGTGEVGIFDVREGSLTIRVEYEHAPNDIANRRFALRVFQDNNLDGEYNAEGDFITSLVAQKPYEGQRGEPISFEITEEFETAGGRIKPAITSGGGKWTMTITQDPEPMHGIEGHVSVPDDPTPGGIQVVAIDEQGNTYEATTSLAGNYVFDEVFGFRDYHIYVREPGYTGGKAVVTAEQFLNLGFPTWHVEPSSIKLDTLDGHGAVVGTVYDEDTDEPIEGATVALDPTGDGPGIGERTDPAGQYRIEYEPGEPVELSATAPRYEDTGVLRTFELEDGELKRVDIAMKFDGPPDLAVTTSAERLTGAVGNNLTYTVTVTNEGPGATEPTLSVTTPSESSDHIETVEVTAAGEDCDLSEPDRVTCELDELPEDDSVDVDVTVSAETAVLEGENADSETVPQTIAVSGTEPALYERDENNNREGVDFNITTHRIHGQAFTTDQHGNDLPIRNASLELSFDDDTEIRSIHTNATGNYSAELTEAKDNYRVNVSLEDKDGLIEVYTDHGTYPGGNAEVITLRTTRFQISGNESNTNVQFATGYPHFARPLTGGYTPTLLQDAGVFYANTYKAATFARQNLSIRLDHTPVDVHLWRPFNGGARYFKGASRIEVDNQPGDSNYQQVSDSPDNREHHEFGHHVNADARMGGEDTYPNRLPGDDNHGSIRNDDSRDAVNEGFAEFYALMINGSSRYAWGNSVTNLEANFHTTAHNGNQIADEEFMVASLLWDLLDANNEGPGSDYTYPLKIDDELVSMDDHFSLSEEEVWSILNSHEVVTVRDIYERLQDDPDLADQEADNDGIDDVDELFILHHFYSDRNENNQWDNGEPVGYPNRFEPRWDGPGKNDPREMHPPMAGSTLNYSLETAEGETLRAAAFRVRVDYNGTERDYAYRTDTRSDSGNLSVFVPSRANRVEIEPIVPGYAAEPFVETPEDFWPAVTQAQRDNQSIYATHSFAVEDNGVPAPTKVEASAVNDSAILLTWDASGEVLIVHSHGQPPRYPGEGRVVFSGSVEEFVDTGALAGINHSYTVFAVEDGKLSEGVSASAVTDGPAPVVDEPASDDSEELPWLWVVGVVVVGLFVAGLRYARSRFGRSEENPG